MLHSWKIIFRLFIRIQLNCHTYSCDKCDTYRWCWVVTLLLSRWRKLASMFPSTPCDESKYRCLRLALYTSILSASATGSLRILSHLRVSLAGLQGSSWSPARCSLVDSSTLPDDSSLCLPLASLCPFSIWMMVWLLALVFLFNVVLDKEEELLTDCSAVSLSAAKWRWNYCQGLSNYLKPQNSQHLYYPFQNIALPKRHLFSSNLFFSSCLRLGIPHEFRCRQPHCLCLGGPSLGIDRFAQKIWFHY